MQPASTGNLAMARLHAEELSNVSIASDLHYTFMSIIH